MDRRGTRKIILTRVGFVKRNIPIVQPAATLLMVPPCDNPDSPIAQLDFSLFFLWNNIA